MTGTWQEMAGTAPEVVSTRRGRVECARYGAGPAVVLLHGAMGGYDQSLLLGASAVGVGGFEFVAVSRPGYLGTPLESGVAPAEQADLCAALLDELGIAQAAVIAVSGGGQCALQFALRHGARCRALVMISACSAPVRSALPLRFHVISLLARIPAVVRMLERRPAPDPERAAAASIPDPELRRRTLAHPQAGPLLAALQRSTMREMGRRMPGTRNDIAQSREAFAYPVEEIQAPVLVVHGTEDQLVPVADAEALAARVPRGELLRIDGAPHVALFTHYDLIQARVGGLLEGRG